MLASRVAQPSVQAASDISGKSALPVSGRASIGQPRTVSDFSHERGASQENAALEPAKPSVAWVLNKSPSASPCQVSNLLPRVPVAATPSAAIQTKLVVGSVDDPLEHEADRMADRVMRMSTPLTSADEAIQRKCDACKEEEPSGKIRAKRSGASEFSGAEAPAAVSEVLNSPGAPLDASARAFFEPRFVRDFSRVRIHADNRAARSARGIGARAYAVGHHIAFAEGQYAPGSDLGRHLLAHELTHTIQQGASRIRRCDGAMQQEDEAAADNGGETPRFEEEAAGAAEQVVQRSVAWNGATVHETVNPANTPFGGSDPISWHLLNGTKLETEASADGAIKVPSITSFPLPSTDPTAIWAVKVAGVPAQEGSADETVLAPGPWTRVVTKAQAGAVTGLSACAGAGNSTFTRRGNPSDDAVYKANRRHEDHHVADHKVAFEDAIGKWDKKLEDAKAASTVFTGSSEADATAKLWAAMGNTPTAAARSYRSQGFAKGAAFHRTPAGGPMSRSNPVSNADCSTSGMDVTNPS